MRVAAIVGALAIAACADLTPRAPDLCGNDVLDTSEDCDGRVRPEHAGPGVTCAAADATHACHYVCTGDASCPAGWGCGDDGVCRFASGRYVAASTSTLVQDATIALADVDGDGHYEIVVDGLDEAYALFGAGDGTLAAGPSLALPWFKPRVGLGDLDLDGRADLIAGSNYGVVEFLGQTSGTFAPFVHPRFRAPLFPQDGGTFATSLQTSAPFAQPLTPDQHIIAVSNHLGQVRFDVRNQQTFAAEAPPVDIPLPFADIRTGRRVDVEGDGVDEILSLFANVPEAKIVSVTVATSGAPVVTSIGVQTVTLPAAVPNYYMFGDLHDADGDGLRDLFVGQPDFRVAIAPNLGGGVFGPAVVAPKFDGVGQGGVGVPYASIDLGSAGRGWVAQGGVFTDDATPTLIDRPSVLWNEAVVGDFNHDGRVDIAASSYATTGIDLWLQSPTHLFAHARVPTDATPWQLLVGDFDGDGTTDLAFIEGGDPEPMTVGVMFGGPQGLGERVAAGTWDVIESFDTASVQITPEVARDGITDLAVQGVRGGEHSFTYLIGSTQRQLIGPYVTRTDQPARFVTGDVSVVGNFGSPGGFAPDNIPDVALVNFGARDPAFPATLSLNAWVVSGTGGGDLEAPARELAQLTRVVPGLDRVVFDPGIGFSRCSTWQAADLDGDGLDELIGLIAEQCSNTPQLFIGHPDGTGKITFSDKTLPLRPEVVGKPNQVQVIDLDVDGTPEIIVSSALGVTVYFRNANGTYDPVGLPTELGVPNRATVLNTDDDPQLEIVSFVRPLTGPGPAEPELVVFELDHRSFRADGVAGTSPGGELRAADINHDGVDDLVLFDPLVHQLHVLLAIPHGATP